MVLLSFKFLHIVYNDILFTTYFSLSCCVCVFKLLHSSIACDKLFGINLKDRKKVTYPANSTKCFSWLTRSTPTFIVEERSYICIYGHVLNKGNNNNAPRKALGF